MQHNSNEVGGKSRRFGMKLALVGAGLAVGAITATTVGANAVTIGSTAAASTGSPSSSSAAADAHAPRSMRGDEKTVTGATATTLKAAALKAVPGGTVDRVETDSGDATYEAHMTKADGTAVTVKFGKNLAVTGVEAGMGK